MDVRGPARRRAFERLYSAVVTVKGVDGLVEPALGTLLLVAPDTIRVALIATAAEPESAC